MTIADNELAAIEAQLPPDLSQEEIDALIAEWIEWDSSRRRIGDVRIAEYGVHVWALIGHLPVAHNDLHQLADAYDLPVRAVEAAIFFYLRYRCFIDDRLAANDDDERHGRFIPQLTPSSLPVS